MRRFLVSPSLLTNRGVSIAMISTGLAAAAQPVAAQCEIDSIFIPGPEVSVPANGATTIVSADFNEDGIPDYATVRHLPGGVSVTLGLPDAGFTLPVVYDVNVISYPILVASADIDADGHIDLVVRDRTDGRHVSVLRGNGSGGFLSPINGIFSNVYDATIGDLNGDGLPDLIVSTGFSVSWHAGLGDGTFGAATNLGRCADSVGAVAAVDTDGDGDLDLLVPQRSQGRVCLLIGEGDGSFSTGSAVSLGQRATGRPAVADFNNDGILDLVVGVGSGAGLALSLGTSLNRFAPGITYAAHGVERVQLADLNDDGALDAIGAQRYASGFVSLFRGNGDGTLAPPVAFGMPGQTDGVLADATMNGASDFVTVNPISQKIATLVNRCAAPTAVRITPGDRVVPRGAELLLFAESDTAAIVDYQWFFRGQPITDGGSYSGATTNMLRIDPVTPDQEGAYYVRVSTMSDDLLSPAAHVALIRGCSADTDADGEVGLADLANIIASFGTACP